MVVKIRWINGPNKGKTQTVNPGGDEGPMDPIIMMDIVSGVGWDWELDLSEARASENYLWHNADLIIRIRRALFQARSIWLFGREYVGPESGEELIERMTHYKGRLVYEFDDERGLKLVPG